MANFEKRVFVAGHQGLVGSAIVRALHAQGYKHIVMRTRAQLDLSNQAQVRALFLEEGIDEIYMAAAKVGGIHANQTYPADFIYDNLMVQTNVVHEAFRSGVRRLLFLGSSCIYPRLAIQPIKEEYLMTGMLEPTNEAYAMAKIAGIKLCESYNRQYGMDYRSVMPTNLYGPGDNYHPENSHVIPALLRRFHAAKLRGDAEVEIWGSGKAMREFMHVDDMAAACVYLMRLPKEVYDTQTCPTRSHINIGTGRDASIAELARLVGQVVGFRGRIVFDTSKPDGMPRKLLDISRLRALGWSSRLTLEQGLVDTYADYTARLARGGDPRL